MSQRFDEVDEAVAAVLTTVAERIRTRRWRERERGEALQRLQNAFRDRQRWAVKAVCGRGRRGETRLLVRAYGGRGPDFR